jgi:hypothetical protein
MMLLRRFLVIQTLMLWQGGFLFYAVFVVPTGTEVLGGAFAQGRITRLVTQSLNWIGVAAVAIFAWELLQAGLPRPNLKWLWGAWTVMVLSLAGLFAIHPRLSDLADFNTLTLADRDRFRLWHGAYLCVSTAQWLAALLFAFVLLAGWHGRSLPRQNRGVSDVV